MKQEELTQLTDNELLQGQKKLKKSKIITAILIGVFIGIAVYSAIKNGFTFFTFFPLIIVYFIVNNEKKDKALTEEFATRNLDK